MPAHLPASVARPWPSQFAVLLALQYLSLRQSESAKEASNQARSHNIIAPLDPDSDEGKEYDEKLWMFLLREAHGIEGEWPSLTDFCSALDAACPLVVLANEQTKRQTCSCTEYIVKQFESFDTALGLAHFLDGLEALVQPSDDSGASSSSSAELLTRRSRFGILVRRAKVQCSRLDDEGLLALKKELKSWRGGNYTRPLSDREMAWERYIQARKRGDYSAAFEAHHRFFDLHPRGADSLLHQHALLHLAHFHYDHREWQEARHSLDGAIHVARLLSDSQCITACDSLSRRLEAHEPGSSRKPRPTARPPFEADDIWEAARDVHMGVPPAVVYGRLMDAVWASNARSQVGSTKLQSTGPDLPRTEIACTSTSIAASVASLWSMMGHESVADAWRGVALEEQGDVEMRIAAECGEAWKLAEKGSFENSLEALFRDELVDALEAHLLPRWTSQILRIMWLRARRRGDLFAMRFYTLADPNVEADVDGADEANGIRSARRDEQTEPDEPAQFDEPSADSKMLSQLKQARTLFEADAAAHSLDQCLTVLVAAQKSGRARIWRGARVLLAELQAGPLRLGESACLTMEEILPRCLADHDAERKADAMFAYAKAILAKDRDEEGSKREASQWFERASQQYADAGANVSQSKALYYLGRLLLELGEEERAAWWAERLHEVEMTLQHLEQASTLDELDRDVFETMQAVQARIAVGNADDL
ncbi:hypothetical protein IE81DRAFT_367241 [Ceraceosorus guamensis]|uniref:Anaphase-promoting complex subunit 5 n=1 Tax=Ceraceosorus guamensis TaxID=1522189 RepID=A0A316VVS6_9BASI|nr:hypothetical protein IE81DRAFT_367241 [Ceraceosorus guamensis]PWN41757.1 hypothetical protein IE81DRAFT_367241 [Ceraceosorus guamensis]